MTPYRKLAPLTAAAGLLAITGTANAAGTLINTYPTGTTSNIGVTRSSAINGFNESLYTLTTALSGPEFNPGVLDNPADGQHDADTRESWRANNSTAAGAADEWIQWDLGASYQLDSIQLWNYNDSARYASGVRTLDIYFSNVATPGDPEIAGPGNGDNWTHWAVNATIPAGPGSAGYTGFDLETAVGSSLPTTDVRFVRFEVNSTFIGDGISLPGGGTLGGENASLAQIEFFEAVPEPSACLLGGLGLLALLRRRRA